MTGVRVLRLMEYTYDSVEQMEQDRVRWHVQGIYRPNEHMLIKSVVLPFELLPEEPEPSAPTAVLSLHRPEQ